MSATQVSVPGVSAPRGVLHRFRIVGLLAIQAALLLYGVWQTGITADEPNHILGAHFYWQNSKAYPLPDLAPLLKIATGWAPAAVGLEMPSVSDPKWQPGAEWNLALQWSGDLKDPYYSQLTLASRLPLLIFPLGLSALVWFWARAEWGPPAGLLAAAIIAVEPTVLGHGILVKNDVACALAYTAFWYVAWRFWQAPTWRTLAWLAGATLLGISAKLSLLILAGIAPILILLRAPRKAWMFLPAFLVLLYAGLCLVYQGNVRLLESPEVGAVYRHPNAPRALAWAASAFRWIPVPENLWAGCSSLILSSADSPPVYLWGRTYLGGAPWYFLAALAVKVPIGFQVLFLGAGGLAAWRGVRERDARWLFLLLPPLLYIWLASWSSFQLGLRLILPALPFGALLAAAAWQRWRRFVLVAAAAGAMEAMIYYPHGISFFNAWVGGPAQGVNYLVDSNLDWGQDLPILKQWMTRNQVSQVRLTYFGADAPWRYFRDEQLVWDPPPWSKELAAGRTELALQPGIYAISASVLPGHYFEPEYREFYRHFRNRTPTARAGYSIFIYDVR